MRTAKRRVPKFLLVSMMLVLLSCARVPKEVVELSYTVGQDLNAVHSSYRALIQTHFVGLRARTVAFLEDRWIPVFLEDYIKRAELIKMAQGPDPDRVFEDVQDWVEVVVETIESKKRELLDPIDRDEAELLNSVNEAFARLTRANATITAHLNSLRKVQEVQDEALAALNLKDLRDEISKGLISASGRAEEALQALAKAQGLLDKVDEKKKELREKLKGEDADG